MNNKSIYIIIPVHNRKTLTLDCLENLKTNGDLQKYHVIVVDDGSSGRLVDIKMCQAIKSSIPDFNSYGLDIQPIEDLSSTEKSLKVPRSGTFKLFWVSCKR